MSQLLLCSVDRAVWQKQLREERGRFGLQLQRGVSASIVLRKAQQQDPEDHGLAVRKQREHISSTCRNQREEEGEEE